MRFESWSKTDIGLVRETNQDHVGCYPEIGLYVVADGMGGHADGEVASRIAVETLHEAYAGDDVAYGDDGLLRRHVVDHDVVEVLPAAAAEAHGDVALRVHVDEQRAVPLRRQAVGEADRRRGLAGPALLVHHRDPPRAPTLPQLPAASSGPLAWLSRLKRSWTEKAETKAEESDEDGGERDVARLEAAVQNANRRIFDLGHEGGGPATRAMGTTVIALVASPSARRVAWAHVGDSRLYRVRDGKLELLTADHTRFGEPYRAGGPVPLDLPHTNQLVLALGVERSVPVSVGSDAVRPGDVFLLASDGITGLVPPERIAQILRDMRSPAEAGEELIRLALAAGGSDNASAVVLRAGED